MLPDKGKAWESLKAAADRPAGEPNLSDQNQANNVLVLAKALVFARTGEARYRDEVRRACLAAMGTEKGGRTLALGRELAAYIIAADLVGLAADEDRKFRPWLKGLLTAELSGRSLRSTHEDRPNNWGTHAGASRAAIAAYLGDKDELDRVAKVFKGWLGDRASYSGFKYGDLSWQADPEQPVGINPAGASKDGFNLDGIIPDDMRRGGRFHSPPGRTNYPWGALEGAVVQAEILSRKGHPAWQWQDKALLRAVKRLKELDEKYPDKGWWATGDDTWTVWVVNKAYGAALPTEMPTRLGKNMAWTEWTHAPATKK
jgi:hypothetical protein